MGSIRRAVVTGGSGFIGGHLAERLAREGAEVVVFDVAPPPPEALNSGAVAYVKGDITDEAAVARVITPDVDTVFHMSAVVGVDRYLSRPLDVLDVNILGTRNVLRRALDTGARVIMASTSEVYGKNPAVPWAEDDDRVVGPTSAERWTYSSSKALAEHMAFALARGHGLRASVVRYFNVYGPRQRPAYVVSRSIHRVLNGLPAEVYDSGHQTRCFTFIDDAVEGTLRVAAEPGAAGECFNIGGHRETTMAEAVGLVTRLAGADHPPRTLVTATALGDGYQDIDRRVPDTAKALRILGWRAETPLDEGIARTIAWARAAPGWLAS
ncbi:NAD-dependent epimerase/dehydratase family protein [Nocardiopsis sediminis]|uniref:NAD-dependent epimerase/dehydratase family protein n=1 Tax=Nocardiopsis sediminis TaxID=1778267 RepID=A0ABV8FFB1_9ACTN